MLSLFSLTHLDITLDSTDTSFFTGFIILNDSAKEYISGSFVRRF